jgi:hypothetical protein
VEALAGLENVKILIGVREEDWREAHGLSYRVRVKDVSVRLEMEEARDIFAQLQATQPGDFFVSFEDAWTKFGAGGPLLEFVHLITHHQSLRARLEQQVRKLLTGLSEEETEFCRLAACGTGYGGRVVAKKLIGAVQIGPTKAMSLMTRLEEEYFIRRTGAEYIEAVHLIRSRVLCEFLFDDAFYPISRGLTKSAYIVHGDDLERLLFESFLICTPEHLVADEAVRILEKEKSFSWRACAGLARALLWLDLNAYVSETKEFVALAKFVIPGAWRFLIPWKFQPGWSPETTDALAEARRALMAQYPDREQAATILASRVPTLHYHRLRPFLGRDWMGEMPLNSLSDWISLSELAYWHRTLAVPQPGPLSSVDAKVEIPLALPLQLQAELVSFGERLGGEQWATVFQRIVQRYKVVWFEDSTESLQVVFLVGVREGRTLIERGVAALNARAMSVSSCLRALVPGRSRYGCVGLAWPHQFVDHNPIQKTGIKAHMLEAKWNKRVLPVIMQMIERSTFPATWKEHAAQVRAFRQGFLEGVRAVLIQFAIEPTWNGRWPTAREEGNADWTDCPPLIPNCARDPWGVGNFGWDEDQEDSITWFPERFRKYQETLQSFHTKASALVFELFYPSESECDWEKAFRLAISCWQDLPRLHAVDHTPFRAWWSDSEVFRHEAEERALLAELVAVIDARQKGLAVLPGRALEMMQERVLTLLTEVCAEIAGTGSAATVDYIPFDQHRSAAIIWSPMDTSSIAVINHELTVAKQACWRVLRRRSDELRSEMQLVAESINLFVTVNHVVAASFSLPTIFAISGNEVAFMRTLSGVVSEAECCARGLRYSQGDNRQEDAIVTLLFCSMAIADVEDNWTPLWNRPLVEQCLGEILDDIRGAVRVLLEMSRSTISTRECLAEAANRLMDFCTLFLDDDTSLSSLAELYIAATNWAAESMLEKALKI